MRDLNHPDMQQAVGRFLNRDLPATRKRWNELANDDFPMFLNFGRGVVRFSRAERDLIVAHLVVLGHWRA